ncbi:hypothetical protein [Streptomyces sp. NPDC048577]|uniref:hypothetical protein n=1 Tax=Streptomyces sp. NPDC048577 TaxID=3157209 RepID=UPI00341416F2
MSDFQGWTAPGAGPTGPSGAVHQLVFRWDGNQGGRQDTGMTAVAHSCAPGRAAELGRELGPLLWVSGTAATRPSIVRTVTRDDAGHGEVILVRRWPTHDRAGRPSTVSHVLVGGTRTLKTRQCLGLAYKGWGTRESAERASGRLPTLRSAELDDLARRRLLVMGKRLPTVRDALVQVTAAWLRDPAQRVSLLADGEEKPGWPDPEGTPLVYLGLFLLFGSWLGQEWTFATHDTVDTHPLRLMSVPLWEPDAGGAGPLARVSGDRPAPRGDVEQRAAALLVDRLLTHPLGDRPGLPQLTEELRGAATMDWSRRRALLERVLDTERRSASGGTAPHHPGEPGREPGIQPGRSPERATAREPERTTGWVAETEDAARRAQLSLSRHPLERPPVSRPAPRGRAPEAVRGTVPATGAPGWEPAQSPDLPPARPTTPTQAASSAGAGPSLHEELRTYRGPARQSVLAARLRQTPDEHLLEALRTPGLPPSAVDLLFAELRQGPRLRARTLPVRHALCTEVLRNHLSLAAGPQDPASDSRTAGDDRAERAAELFTWAVAPLAREERHLRDLQELLHRMTHDRRPAASAWLRRCVTEPENGVVPDLPPVLWQQVVRMVVRQGAATAQAGPSAAVPPGGSVSPAPVVPSATVVPPAFPAGTGRDGPASSPPAGPEIHSVGGRLSELATRPGCVLGTGAFAVLALIVTIVVLFV